MSDDKEQMSDELPDEYPFKLSTIAKEKRTYRRRSPDAIWGKRRAEVDLQKALLLRLEGKLTWRSLSARFPGKSRMFFYRRLIHEYKRLIQRGEYTGNKEALLRAGNRHPKSKDPDRKLAFGQATGRTTTCRKRNQKKFRTRTARKLRYLKVRKIKKA